VLRRLGREDGLGYGDAALRALACLVVGRSDLEAMVVDDDEGRRQKESEDLSNAWPVNK
jgi:hypothetical protein